jgi:hypothetical protein
MHVSKCKNNKIKLKKQSQYIIKKCHYKNIMIANINAPKIKKSEHILNILYEFLWMPQCTPTQHKNKKNLKIKRSTNNMIANINAHNIQKMEYMK